MIDGIHCSYSLFKMFLLLAQLGLESLVCFMIRYQLKLGYRSALLWKDVQWADFCQGPSSGATYNGEVSNVYPYRMSQSEPQTEILKYAPLLKDL